MHKYIAICNSLVAVELMNNRNGPPAYPHSEFEIF